MAESAEKPARRQVQRGGLRHRLLQILDEREAVRTREFDPLIAPLSPRHARVALGELVQENLIRRSRRGEYTRKVEGLAEPEYVDRASRRKLVVAPARRASKKAS